MKEFLKHNLPGKFYKVFDMIVSNSKLSAKDLGDIFLNFDFIPNIIL